MKIVSLSQWSEEKYQSLEGQTTIVLLGRFFLMCKTLYAPYVPHSPIIYQNLGASKIHISTALKNNEEVLELIQRWVILVSTQRDRRWHI